MRMRKSAEERRAEIVTAALVLIDRGGPSAATTTAIAQLVGVSQAAVFRHFPKKEEILLAVVERLADHVMPRLGKIAAETAGSPLERLRAVLDVQLAIVRDTPAMPALLFSRELHNENARLRSAVYGHIGRIHDLLAEILRAGTANGPFRADLDIDRAAFMIVGLLQGLVVRWSLSGRRLALLEEGQRMFDMLLDGLLANGKTAS